jgi:hypothetical protein
MNNPEISYPLEAYQLLGDRECSTKEPMNQTGRPVYHTASRNYFTNLALMGEGGD